MPSSPLTSLAGALQRTGLMANLYCVARFVGHQSVGRPAFSAPSDVPGPMPKLMSELLRRLDWISLSLALRPSQSYKEHLCRISAPVAPRTARH